MEATTRCMNGECATTSVEWRRGWQLRSGGFAVLCHKCGMAYEQSIFCDLFHLSESGWRECISCNKRLHCGCIASKNLVELVDRGGVQCFSCTNNSGPSTGQSETIPEFLPLSNIRMARIIENEKSNDVFRVQIGTSNHMEDIFGKGQALQLGKNTEMHDPNKNILSHRESQNESYAQIKREQFTLYTGQMGNTCSGFGKNLMNPNQIKNTEPNFFPSMVEGSRDQTRMISVVQQAQRGHHLLAKPTKMGSASSEASKEAVSQMRVARPPTDGKGRNQLLPRYWPRITDQELQQISGDSNSTVVPLFEKVLSASDAGRIGRLVLPKACAEAYFPPISQPEGIPLKIQDAKGKEWNFQFRFWPNNNSRMYVLEGVTPCIQSLQLQAGDTVTFSRMDPEGKLIMGFRKATNYVPLQDSQISAIANAGLGNDTFFSSSNDNLTLASGGYSGYFQSFKGNADPRPSYIPECLNSTDGDLANVQYHQDRKRTHNIKSKRLHIGNEDALDLKVSWEEAQDLLRPPPSAKPSVVRIEDQEFEEYEEPPVFGKRTIFTVQSSGDQDQWIQCDNCFKWRRLPADVLVSSTWTCTDNTWDPQRSCSKPEELSPTEIQNLLHQISEIKKQRISTSSNQTPRAEEASGLDGLLNAATSEGPSIQPPTTKHPRHRPGCTCIVCIQPPSGKGPKHHANCTCNVCMTVKRRFKTLMLRKKKRQFEKEEAEASKKAEGSGPDKAVPEGEGGPIDLNADVYEEPSSSSKASMTDLVRVATLPLNNYLKQNGLSSLAREEDTPAGSEEGCSGHAKSDAS